jgi:hypothetical protein
VVKWVAPWSSVVNVFHNKDSIWDVMMMGELCLGWLLKTEEGDERVGVGKGRYSYV